MPLASDYPTRLLWRSSLRHLRHHPWLILLSLFGISLGVAVVIAVDLANSSAHRAMQLSNETLTGRATHQIISGPAGLPDSLYRQIRIELGIRQCAPVVVGHAIAPSNHQTFQILGIDPLADFPFRQYSGGNSGSEFLTRLLTTPNAVLITGKTAHDLGVNEGETLRVNVAGTLKELRVVGLISSQSTSALNVLSSVLLTDIATAQELLQQSGHLSRIDLIIEHNDTDTLSRLRAQLPPQAQLVDTREANSAQNQMTQAFQTNLRAMSLLALLVGAFIIFNTMSFSVLQRRRLMGLQRALGVSATQIWWLIVAEAALAGIMGSALGLVLGVFIADGLLGLVTRTINDLYFNLSVTTLDVGILDIMKGFAIGLAATLIASAPVTWEATRTAPRATLQRSTIEIQAHRTTSRAALFGIFGIALGVAMFFIPSRLLSVAFFALFLIVMGYALIVPWCVTKLIYIIRVSWPNGFALNTRMAITGVEKSLSRTAVALAALVVAIATTIGVSTMIHSFRDSVINWIGHTLRADIYLSIPDQTTTQVSAINDDLIARLRAIDNVTELSIGRRANIPVGPTSLDIVAVDLPAQGFQGFERIDSMDDAWKIFQTQTALMISEPYAYRHELHVGDHLRLPTAHGEVAFLILAIYRDYGSDQGRIAMRRSLYQQNWNDDTITNIGIYLRDTGRAQEMLPIIRAALPTDKPLVLRANADIRKITIEIFDRTFAITDVLRFLTLGVALVGIVTALMALHLERAREFAVLRAIGFTPRQLWRLVSSESAAMGFYAGLFAIPLGLGMAFILIFVINRRAFGWSMEFGIDGWQIISALLLALIAAFLAAIYPAYRMAQTSPALALREE